MKTFIKNRHNLRVSVLVKENSGKKGLAFVVHGLGGFKEQEHLAVLDDVLFSKEYTIVTFDTTNSCGESEGKFENASFQGYYEDLLDVISWSKSQPWHQIPYVLVGHSIGGYCAARYAEEHPEEVKAVFPYAVGVAGELVYKKLYNEEFLKKWKEIGWKIEEHKAKPGLITKLPWSYMEEIMKHDLRPNASKLKMPVLLMVGENDTSCPPEIHKAFYDLIPGPKELHVIAGAPHTFTNPSHLAKSKEIFEKWLTKISS